MTLVIGGNTYPVHQDPRWHTNRAATFPNEPFQSLFSEDQDLHVEAQRLKTFLLWPTWGKADPNKLAQTGFFFTGDEDKCKCFECAVEISHWSESESPMSVHKRKSPYCALVRGGKTKNVPLNPEPSDEKSSKGSKNRRKGKKANGANQADQADSLEDEPDSNTTSPLAVPDSHTSGATGTSKFVPLAKSQRLVEEFDRSNMKLEENRLRTFEGKWPSDNPLSPGKVARAGFWYLGPHDRVECAFCRGRLLNFVPGDDPVGEHARHFPACPFIQELNNEPLRALKTRSARAMLQLGYSEANILMAINMCKQDGKEYPKAEDIQDAIFVLEEEKEKQTEAAVRVAVDNAYQCDGHRSGFSTGFTDENECDSTISAPEEVKQLRKKNEELKLSTTCKVCLGKEVNCVFLPCRHLVCCSDCASRIDYCPVCRLKIIGTVKTFMA